MNPHRSRAIVASVQTFGLRVVCLVCGKEQRFFAKSTENGIESAYPDRPRRLRDTPCEVSLCGEKALRSRYWISRHPELALEAQRRARAVSRVQTGR